MIKTFILAVQTAPTNNAGMNLWDMVVMGGWLMIPIFILSVIIIYIACERFWLIRKTGLTGCPFHGKNTRNFENRKHTCRTRRM